MRHARAYGFILQVISALLLTQPAAATTSALAQQTAVGIEDSFQLVVETDQDISRPPDFGVLLNDFEILGNSKSTNVSIVNGRLSRSTNWVLELMARRAGNLVIPAIVVGKERTAAIDVTVTETAPGPIGAPLSEVDLEIDVDNLSPYVQAQFIFTVRLVHTVQLANASLTEPTITGGNVIIEKLGDDIAYETTRGQTRVGVLERRYAMFAQSSEEITIEPLRFEGQVADNRRTGFDPLARGRRVRKQSATITVNIKPVAAAFSGKTWLPARQLMLVENSPSNTTEYHVGEPFMRTLTLQATGLSSSQLPEIDVSAPADIKQYPDQPVLQNRVSTDGLVASRQEKIALIPSRPGKVTIPPIEIPWWNTQTNRQEYARLPARTIEVLPALLPATNAPPVGEEQQSVSAAERAEITATAISQLRNGDRIWPWLSLALATGWLATALAWLWNRRKRSKEVAPKMVRPRERQLLAAIKAACDANDAAACKTALLAWASLQWPGSGVRSLGALAAQLEGDLQEQVHTLSQNLYRSGGAGWDGKKLWLGMAARQKNPLPKSAKSKPQLEPLYH